MDELTSAQRGALLAAVWAQGTRRLVWERPHGDVVDDPTERMHRLNQLRPHVCPAFAAYQARAIPVLTELACDEFGQPETAALRMLFHQVQTGVLDGMLLLQRVSRHADLDYIVESEVRPWLETHTAKQP